MYTIGILSNSPSYLAQIHDEATQIFNELTTLLLTFTYTNTTEIKDLIEAHPEVDGWMFSDEMTYLHGQQYVKPHTPMTYCQLNRLEFFHFLLVALYQSPSHELRVSVDFPESNATEWSAALTEAHISPEPLKWCTYDALQIDNLFSDITKSHQVHWQNGQIDRVLTSSPKVYDALQASGVPVLQMRGSTFTIQSALATLREQITRQELMNNQVAIVRFEVTDIEKLLSIIPADLRFQLLELRIKESMINLCKDLHGSYLSDKDSGRYEIFASRGIIEENIPTIAKTLANVRDTLSVEMTAGIGIGFTAFEAQRHAFQALAYGRRQTPAQSIVSIDTDGTIIELPHTEDALRFTASVSDPKLLEVLKSVGVGVKNFNRLKAVAEKMPNGFTPAELADHLSVTDRSARRLLANLAEVKLVEVIGEEATAERGRPTKRYKLKA